jgi:hypothetical protein
MIMNFVQETEASISTKDVLHSKEAICSRVQVLRFTFTLCLAETISKRKMTGK